MITDCTTPRLPARDPQGHKGTFGTVVIIGGSLGGRSEAPRMMLGGPCLTARAALRAGCGLVVLAVPAPLAPHAIELVPEATVIPLPVDATGALQPSAVAAALDASTKGANAFVIGPGLGLGIEAEQVLLRLLANTEVPVIIDADAITLFAQAHDAARDLRTSAVFTPHPGEAQRLAQGLELEIEPGFIEGNRDARRALTTRLAQRLGAVICMKGAGTLICDGLHMWSTTRGNAALATAGSGDILAGIIASFAAQFCTRNAAAARASEHSQPLTLGEATALAVEVHARAAEAWANNHGTAGLLAHELADGVPNILHDLRG